MFTMKKFAVLAIAGFFASSMIACSEVEDDPDDSSSSTTNPSSPSGGWTLSDLSGAGWSKKEVTLGDINSGTGSFLDVDDNFNVITQGGALAAKDNIDIIYDGTNLWTPYGCTQTASCDYKSYVAGASDLAFLYNVSGCNISNTASVNDIINDSCRKGAPITNNVVLAASGIYVLQTSQDHFALILVGAKGTNTVKLIVGYEP